MKAKLFNIQKFSIHDGYGIRTTLFFKGCNLRCLWCSNPESQSMEEEYLNGKPCGRDYTLAEILEEVKKDEAFYHHSGGGVTLSGGEPLLQAPFILELCRALHNEGISVAIETAACIDKESFRAVFDELDFAFIDLKHYDSAKHKEATGVGLELILENMRYALTLDKPIIIRIPVIPGYNSSPSDMECFFELLYSLGAKQVHLLPFHQLGESKYNSLNREYTYKGVPQLHDKDMIKLAKILAKDGLDVQIGG